MLLLPCIKLIISSILIRVLEISDKYIIAMNFSFAKFLILEY